MFQDKDKVSTRQILIIFIVMVYSPAVRVMASFTSKQAKQAAWLTPVIGFIFLLATFLMLQNMYRKYMNSSLMDIMYAITGPFIGRFIVLCNILWLAILNALYVRYYGERIVGSILPNVDISLFIIVMLVLVAYICRYGLAVLARMNEVLFPIILTIFLIFIIFLCPKIEFDNLSPISYLDIMPILKGSSVIIAIWVYALFLFMLSDKINDKENIKKFGIQTAIFMFLAITVIIAITIGTLGHTVSARLPLPFLTAVKQISLFGTLEKIESILTVTWIAADFTLISVFVLIIMNMTKSVFKLRDTKPFINIFCIFLSIFSLYVSKSRFELGEFSTKIAIPANIILGFIIPVLVFFVGKIRKKL